jgi:isopenicillin N synthase-like dioxygenase
MAATIPVIDLADDATAEAAQAARLVDAAADHGFIYIRNAGAGVTDMDVAGAFEIAKTLFGSPAEDKQKCAIQNNNRGWVGERAESLDPKTQKFGDSKEAFNFGEFTNNGTTPQQPLPPAVAPHAPAIGAFRARCHALCVRILYLLGLGLGLDRPDFFSAAHAPDGGGESGTTLRFLRYPPRGPGGRAGEGAEGIRAGAHSDYGSITLLFRLRGQAGLQILARDRQWHPVPVLPPGTANDPHPPVLVNIGDLLSYWTNGLFRSTVHRVVFGSAASSTSASAGSESPAAAAETDDGFRYSIAFFCHPVGDTPLEPVPCERVANFAGGEGGGGDEDDGNPYARSKVLTAREHLMLRRAATYGDVFKGGEKGGES